MPKRDLISLDVLSVEQLQGLLALSKRMKAKPEDYKSVLAGRSLAMIFQKPSTRTRVSFQVGMLQLGGHALVLNANELQLGRGESVPDTARVFSRYVDAVMARVFEHKMLEDLAKNASIPIINGLSDLLHPCQAIADYLTMSECFGELKGLRVAYVGDGNNVAHSLCNGAAKLGVRFTIACPSGYTPDAQIVARAQQDAGATGAEISVTDDVTAAVSGAQVVYTDTWTSMGQESENERRVRDLAPYQVNAQLFEKAAPNAIFLHCLPAHRGEEVTDEVADHPRSAIFDQAENRLHCQKAVLAWVMQQVEL